MQAETACSDSLVRALEVAPRSVYVLVSGWRFDMLRNWEIRLLIVWIYLARLDFNTTAGS